uniref:Uncharacterized protein n=2 Tax=Nyssomyia neivai TaxID=330878 RepID=A0A1L8D8G8_9DIPT
MRFLSVGVSGTLVVPTRACEHLSSTPSGAPLTKSLGPVPKRDCLRGVQYDDMDLRSRENSNVNSFFHFVSISWRTQMAAERRSSPVFGTLNGFIFSPNTMRAVSVASPTFSKACLNSLKSMAESLHITQIVPISWSVSKSLAFTLEPLRYRSPIGSYVDPVSSNSRKLLSPPSTFSKTNIRETDIWLVVKVPVLSEQITDVQPRVSTDGRERTMAFFLAIRRVPRAKQVVMTAGRPSGIAATARATAILK